jgi:hypothetical protein
MINWWLLHLYPGYFQGCTLGPFMDNSLVLPSSVRGPGSKVSNSIHVKNHYNRTLQHQTPLAACDQYRKARNSKGSDSLRKRDYCRPVCATA